MTDEAQTETPEQIEARIAAAAAGAQSAEPVEADKAPAEPEAAPAAPQTAPEAVEPAEEGDEDAEPAYVHNLNALRGIPAGPAPHPRTV